jgi:hypothetical protein
MKTILAAILLATTALAATAEPNSRRLQVMCGSFEDVELTMEKYGEKLIMATQAPNEQTVNLVYANFETETTSWFIHDLNTDEYCMVGVGKRIYIPDSSPLKQGTGLGVKTIFK